MVLVFIPDTHLYKVLASTDINSSKSFRIFNTNYFFFVYKSYQTLACHLTSTRLDHMFAFIPALILRGIDSMKC